jgi:NAD dependent epimerase/dehydratase family enzyme
MQGAYNTVAPDHIINRDVMKALADALNRPFWAPNVPSSVMKILFGEMANILLKGSRISADKIKEAGYEFRFTDLKDAVSL